MTLLVAEYLAIQSRRDGTLPAPVSEHEIADFLCDARERFGRYWRKSAREPGGERELAMIAIERLEKLRLVERIATDVRPCPALARFALGDADIQLFGEARRSMSAPRDGAS